jgi:hypothetical protein
MMGKKHTPAQIITELPEAAEIGVGNSLDRGEDGVQVQHRIAHVRGDQHLETAADGSSLNLKVEELLDDLAVIRFRSRPPGASSIPRLR